ncbi:MAG: 1,2-phenylacetyl-CoA epoxidase subunit B [Acidimicrobiia bacterium]|nr:MAG: 1,2-phenylacetyl-CoA epoxidase subunit B [Acidimicrobiia bacterium]
MSYQVPVAPGEKPEEVNFAMSAGHGFPLWEVFIRPKRGLSHTHVGSLHAPDAETAIQNARDAYTRRAEGVSVWVVPSVEIVASDDAESMFEPFEDKPYRHPTFYEIPEEVDQL